MDNTRPDIAMSTVIPPNVHVDTRSPDYEMYHTPIAEPSYEVIDDTAVSHVRENTTTDPKYESMYLTLIP